MHNYNLSQINTLIEKYHFFVCDTNVYKLYENQFQNLKGKNIFFLDNPEADKNINMYDKALSYFLANNISREDKILSIGGGATSDFAGFVASTILRGIEWEIIPTTILASIDASIGGKTAINTPYGKNLIGRFHNPSTIYFCDDFFKTLPQIEYQSSLGELIKYALLDVKIYEAILKKDLSKAFELSRKFKIDLVSTDPLEKNERKLLNLGHTFGHCYETLLKIPHGQAVFYGIKLICELYAPDELNKIQSLANILSLDWETPLLIERKEFLDVLSKDKKRAINNEISLIIPNSNNKSFIQKMNLTKVIEDLDRYNENCKIYL